MNKNNTFTQENTCQPMARIPLSSMNQCDPSDFEDTEPITPTNKVDKDLQEFDLDPLLYLRQDQKEECNDFDSEHSLEICQPIQDYDAEDINGPTFQDSFTSSLKRVSRYQENIHNILIDEEDDYFYPSGHQKVNSLISKNDLGVPAQHQNQEDTHLVYDQTNQSCSLFAKLRTVKSWPNMVLREEECPFALIAMPQLSSSKSTKSEFHTLKKTGPKPESVQEYDQHTQQKEAEYNEQLLNTQGKEKKKIIGKSNQLKTRNRKKQAQQTMQDILDQKDTRICLLEQEKEFNHQKFHKLLKELEQLNTEEPAYPKPSRTQSTHSNKNHNGKNLLVGKKRGPQPQSALEYEIYSQQKIDALEKEKKNLKGKAREKIIRKINSQKTRVRQKQNEFAQMEELISKDQEIERLEYERMDYLMYIQELQSTIEVSKTLTIRKELSVKFADLRQPQ